MVSRVMENTFYCNLDNRDILRKLIVKIGLERINLQKGVIVEVLLDSSAIILVMILSL